MIEEKIVESSKVFSERLWLQKRDEEDVKEIESRETTVLNANFVTPRSQINNDGNFVNFIVTSNE